MVGANEYVIEKGVPIPASRRSGMSDAIRRLEVGDSVVIPVSTYIATNLARQVFGKGFVTIRKVDATSVRVWRIK